MSLFDRLLGRNKDDDDLPPSPRPAATARAAEADADMGVSRETQVGLQVLFPAALSLDAHILTRRLCAFHPALNSAIVEIDRTSMQFGTPTGQARWGRQVVDFAGSNTKMPPEVVENCLANGHYNATVKQEARYHRSYIRVHYAAENPIAIERYVAVAAVAGTLGSTGAIAVLNENARTSLPIEDILPSEIRGDRLEYFRTMPIPQLYAGFAIMDIAGQPGTWMRTYGCQLLKLPNLATMVSDRGQAGRIQHAFARIFEILLDAKRPLVSGATLQVGASRLSFRSPTSREYFLRDATELFVVEELPDGG